MKSKFWFLTGVSLKKKVKTKWFLIANIILCLGLVLVINIDSVIAFFGGDFDDDINIVLVDETDYNASDVFKTSLDNTNKLLENDAVTNIEVSSDSIKDATEKLKDTDKILIVFKNDDKDYLKASIISNDTIDVMYYNTLVQALTLTKTTVCYSKSNIDVEELNRITSPIDIERVLLNDEEKSEDENSSLIMSTVFPAVILPFYILVIFLVQMIGAEINEEKQTRSMEVIISNVSPKVHFFSKVLAANTFVIFQAILLFLYSGLGLLVRSNLSSGSTSSLTDGVGDIVDMLRASGVMEKLVYIIPLTLVLMILSFVLYSLVAGILASMTVNMEDYQQIQTPIMFVSLGGYYLAIMAAMFKGSILIRALSYVPFISCLLSPALLVIGEIGIFDVIISIIVLCIFIYVLIRYGLKIYKVGILNYSTDKMWSKLFKAAKTKDI